MDSHGFLSHPIARSVLRGGAGEEHERLKLAALEWLWWEGYVSVDFEVGGFDVLGIRKPLGLLGSRVVIDAKISRSDARAHFRKRHIPDCDVDGKFSKYAAKHYLIAPEGLLPADLIQPPWGLLETNQAMEVTIKKVAEERAYVGDPHGELFEISARWTAFLREIIATPKATEEISREAGKWILNREEAQQRISELKDDLVRKCATFETLYGYNPLRKRYLEDL